MPTKKRRNMLETIYETDENIISHERDEDFGRLNEQPSRLSYYICWCMIIGCFLTLTLLIAISLNPFLLSKTPVNKNSINSADKLILSTNIIKHLDIFSHQINEQLDLPPKTITFFTSTISESSSENQNDSGILWIYSYLKYPQSCIDNDQCKENLTLKLKISFTRLSDFFSAIQFNAYPNKQIQVDWCNLIENSTKAILVSLVSITSINQSATEPVMLADRYVCKENIDQNILLSKQSTHKIRFHKDRLKTEKDTNSPACSKYIQRSETLQCPNDIDTQIFLMWNSY